MLVKKSEIQPPDIATPPCRRGSRRANHSLTAHSSKEIAKTSTSIPSRLPGRISNDSIIFSGDGFSVDVGQEPLEQCHVADYAHALLAAIGQLHQCLKGIGNLGAVFPIRKTADRQGRDRPVNHVQVDVIGPEPPKGRVAVLDQCIRPGMTGGDLRSKDQPVAREALDRLAQRLFAASFVEDPNFHIAAVLTGSLPFALDTLGLT